MFKRLLERFRRNRGVHKASVQIDFFDRNLVTPGIIWHQSQDRQADTVTLIIYLYARILYELAELNEARVARELVDFVNRISQRVMTETGPPARPQLPLGQLHLAPAPAAPALRSYQADFYQLQDGNYLLEFRGALGKENFYLPGGFLALLQSCLNNLDDEPLTRLARGLGRIHQYYRYRQDFWDGVALSAAPAFALGTEELHPEEPAPE